MKTLLVALRSAVFSTSFIFFWGWIAWSLHRRYHTALAFSVPARTHPLGIVLLAAGGTLALACITTFFTRGEGTPAPFDPPRKFVAAGPYKFVRNPMYIGSFVVLVGFGFYEHSPAILLFAPVWLLLAHLFVIFYEEPHLRATFGTTYEDYGRSVRRWMPRL